MRLSSWAFLIVAAVVIVALSACGHTSSSSGDTDVTSQFLGEVGGTSYSTGTDSSSLMRISPDGRLKILISGDCEYVVTAQITNVDKTNDGHYTIRYTKISADLIGPSVKSDSCQKMLAEYTFNHIPEKTTMIACSYSREVIDVACTGDKTNPSNWKRN